MMYDYSETVVWCSVDNHQEDLEFASRVLDDMPFAQLHLGSGLGKQQTNSIDSSDEGQHEDIIGNNCLVVELDLETVGVLESMGVLLYDGDTNGDCDNDSSNAIIGDNNTDVSTVRCMLNSCDLAVVENIIHCNEKQIQHTDQTTGQEQQQQNTIIKMIDVAVDSVRKDPLNKSNEPHLVLIAHSISASAVAAAISAWKQHQTQQKQQPVRRVEDLLHQALTVVTFGNVCQSFCDGPAYIHISMYDDPWTVTLGSNSNNDAGGGRDAVYFHACSPYEYDQVRWESVQQATAICSLESHNAHNLNACTIQYLCLLMRINGIQSFRALYDAASFVDPTFILDINPKHFAVSCNHGDLVVPPKLDYELLPAMIRATRGDKWIWKFNGDHDDEVESLLPDEIETRSHLEESFGYNALEDIYATCCR